MDSTHTNRGDGAASAGRHDSREENQAQLQPPSQPSDELEEQQQEEAVRVKQEREQAALTQHWADEFDMPPAAGAGSAAGSAAAGGVDQSSSSSSSAARVKVEREEEGAAAAAAVKREADDDGAAAAAAAAHSSAAGGVKSESKPKLSLDSLQLAERMAASLAHAISATRNQHWQTKLLKALEIDDATQAEARLLHILLFVLHAYEASKKRGEAAMQAMAAMAATLPHTTTAADAAMDGAAAAAISKQEHKPSAADDADEERDRKKVKLDIGASAAFTSELKVESLLSQLSMLHALNDRHSAANSSSSARVKTENEGRRGQAEQEMKHMEEQQLGGAAAASSFPTPSAEAPPSAPSSSGGEPDAPRILPKRSAAERLASMGFHFDCQQ